MADEDRTATDVVAFSRDVEAAPYNYSFYQVLREIECLYREKPRLGQSARIGDDPIRLGQQPTVAFAPSTLAAAEPGKHGESMRMQVYFFGVFGPNGPLPLHLTEYARSRIHNDDDPTFARFADIFHHRMLCFFYRAWADAQPTVQFDRPKTDRFAAYVGSLCGLGMPSLRNRDKMPDMAKLHFVGRMSCQTKNAEGLQAILESFFSVSAEVVPFVGHWMTLPPDARCRLGESRQTGLLGVNAVIGSRVWDCQYKFRIVLGPMSYRDYHRLLPGGKSLEKLRDIVRNYVGDELICEVKLILKGTEVPRTILGKLGQLGRTTWLLSKPLERDADDFTWQLTGV